MRTDNLKNLTRIKNNIRNHVAFYNQIDSLGVRIVELKAAFIDDVAYIEYKLAYPLHPKLSQGEMIAYDGEPIEIERLPEENHATMSFAMKVFHDTTTREISGNAAEYLYDHHKNIKEICRF